MKGIDPKWTMYLGLLVTIQQAIGHGTVSLTNLVPADWAPYITSWCNFLAFIGTSIMTYQAAVSSPTAGPAINTPLAPTSTVVKILIVAFALSAFLATSPAQAQVKLGPIGTKIEKDIQSATSGNATTSSTSSATKQPCDITLFTKLTVTNVVSSIKDCVGSIVAGGAKPFVDDITDALASAKTANDGTATACLTPALAIAQAAEGTPAVIAADGTVTTPARYPGPITIFQKYREFVNAGGPSNCKTAVQSTIAGTVGSAAF